MLQKQIPGPQFAKDPFTAFRNSFIAFTIRGVKNFLRFYIFFPGPVDLSKGRAQLLPSVVRNALIDGGEGAGQIVPCFQRKPRPIVFTKGPKRCV